MEIPAEDCDQDDKCSVTRHRILRDWWKILILVTATSSLISFGSFSLLGYHMGKASRSNDWQHLSNIQCGTTLSEAQELGCEFDLVTNNWMPKQCADPDTTREFREWVANNARLHQSWPYYLDGKGERQIASEEDMSKMIGQRLYTTTENHLGHCTFLMRRLHRFINNGASIISQINLNHTIHCSSAILQAIGSPDCDDRGKITSGFDVGIGGC